MPRRIQEATAVIFRKDTNLFVAALVVLGGLQLWAFGQCVLYRGYPWKVAFFEPFLDAAVLYLPSFLLPRKIRGTVSVTVFFIFTCFLLANTWYERNFGDFMPGNIIGTTDILNSFVINSTRNSLKWWDCLIAAPFFIILAIYLRYRKDMVTDHYSVKSRILTVICVVVIFGARFGLAARRSHNWSPYALTYKDIIYEDITSLTHPTCRIQTVQYWGIPMFFMRTLYECVPRTYTLSPEELQEINELLSSSGPLPQDTVMEELSNNKGKNLILIIVESLHSSVLTLPVEENICPTLHALASDSGSITALNVIPNAGLGRSADGQLIYNTGLLPLEGDVFITDYATADYPSLAKALRGYTAVEAIGERKEVWNHHLTTLSYGYTRLYENLAGNCDGMNEDAEIFNAATDIISGLPQPFFIEITSLSMHEPFDKPKVSPTLDNDSEFINRLDSRDRYYLEAVKHFDTALGEFIQWLRNNGLADKSVIVLAGDHEAAKNALSPLLSHPTVPLIIYNAGYKLNHPQPINQIDVFPTILDVMGINSMEIKVDGETVPYRGLGRSIFAPALTYSTYMSDDWLHHRQEICDKIIRSRYFSTTSHP